jgi:hypothetical protein
MIMIDESETDVNDRLSIVVTYESMVDIGYHDNHMAMTIDRVEYSNIVQMNSNKTIEHLSTDHFETLEVRRRILDIVLVVYIDIGRSECFLSNLETIYRHVSCRDQCNRRVNRQYRQMNRHSTMKMNSTHARSIERVDFLSTIQLMMTSELSLSTMDNAE